MKKLVKVIRPLLLILSILGYIASLCVYIVKDAITKNFSVLINDFEYISKKFISKNMRLILSNDLSYGLIIFSTTLLILYIPLRIYQKRVLDKAK